ncbi:CHASE domain-containing protein [Mycolicibacterium sp. CH28]|uniref:CHASE domain-containing protein n=1 Tax=Mycolicibacterium sp. CH28 TaxID=2512237 RepID=UPI001387009D|nr:CHASE domain-containing protein [Mycolicibacterium sp. CH28]
MTVGLLLIAVLAISAISMAYWLTIGTLQSLPQALVPEYLGAAVSYGVISLAAGALYLFTPTARSRILIAGALIVLSLACTMVWLGPFGALAGQQAVQLSRGAAPVISQVAAFTATLLCWALLLGMAQHGRTVVRVAAELMALAAAVVGVSTIVIYAYGEDLSAPFEILRRVRLPAALSITLLAVAIVTAENQWTIHRLVRRLGWGAGAFFGVLLVLLALTGVTWRIAESGAKSQLSERFQSDTEAMERLVESNLMTDIKALKGGASLFAASSDVDRANWKAYVDGLDLARDYPGVLGYGYSEVLPRDQLAATEKAIRAEGLPEFSIFPVEPIRDVYTAIVFLEPLDDRNRRAIGFDMFSEPVRRDAMTRARDSGEPAMSSPVLLLQENEAKKQKGFLVYEPVYRKGRPTTTTAERIAALQGYVYSPFRANDFIDAALGNQRADIRLEVFEQDPGDPEALVATKRLYGEPPSEDADFRLNTVRTMHVADRTWLLRFTASPAYVSFQDTTRPLTVLSSGLLVSVAMALATYFLASSRQRALSIAGALTEDLANERDMARLGQQKDEMLLNGIIEAMIVFNRDGVIERINAATAAMLGASEEQLLDKHYQDVLIAFDKDGNPYPPEQRPIALALRNRKRIANAVIHYQRSDGSTFPALLSVAPLIHNNELFGAIGIFRDISEEHRLDKAKDEFLSVASHQLRTPITAQSWLLDILTDPDTVGELTPQQLDVATKLIQSNERLAALVTALLNVSRIESGRLTVAPVPTDLVELTRSILDEAAVELKPRGQRTTVEAAELPTIDLDPVLVRQVILNLVTNASKYSPDHASIDVSIEVRGDDIVYRVTDHGYGIPWSQRDQVFSKFYRGSNILDKQTDGNGLGLHLAKSIVELCGGTISFESVENRGTTFQFTLPVRGTPAHDGGVALREAPTLS